MNATIEDLGVQAKSDIWLGIRLGVNPKTGNEVMLGGLSRGGFMVIDPKEESAIQVGFEPRSEGWGIAQAPDGSVWICGYGASGHPACLCRWNWEGTEAEHMVELSGDGYFMIDVAPDGCVYVPHCRTGILRRYNPSTGVLDDLGEFTEFGKTVRDVCCGDDGWVYVMATDYHAPCIAAVNPESGDRHLLKGGFTGIVKAGDGKTLATRSENGETVYAECVDGKAVPIGLDEVRLVRTDVCFSDTGKHASMTPLAFSDGGRICRMYNSDFTYVTGDGQEKEFNIGRKESPLRIFTVESGGGRIWGGTFIPLTMFGHDTRTGESEFYGNPTKSSTGEVYSALWSRDKLFLASYPSADLARYDPSRPWKMDESAEANPAHLGLMKEGEFPLHRPHGKALAPDGTVFFAAHGSYGCEDSGICRIDPDTEEVTRWLYPNTDFGALCYLPGQELLLVSDSRKDEEGIRFTFVSPETGEVTCSQVEVETDGEVTSWLRDDEDADLVYGMYPATGTMFTYSVSQKKIIKRLDEIRDYGIEGGICYNMLIFGPDKRIWGLTTTRVFAVERDLSSIETVVEYDETPSGGNFYRFGMVYGDDGHIYFPNGTHLMRVLVGSQA